ncbi:unnamed protein product [Linum trigynum]|uniref:Zinc-finger domain-containing protein n=1 Tax=Linum trigynum TaxID=586398 RepID=A0AAV2GDJ4_9ROSI
MLKYLEHLNNGSVETSNWICHICLGLGVCNCSFCRQSKELAFTGALHKEIANLGYKSVAPCLHPNPTTRKQMLHIPQGPASEDSAKRPPAFSTTNLSNSQRYWKDEKPVTN